MKSRINKSVKELYNKRYAAQFGKVPEDPNSEEFSEYLQKLKDADLTTQALKLQEAIEIDAGGPNPLEKAMRDAENREKNKNFFRRFLYDQDEDDNWNLSKTKAGVLTVLLLVGVTGAVVLGSPQATSKNITANTSTAKPEESNITGSAVAGAPLEVGSDNLDSLVAGPTGLDIQGQADNVCNPPAEDGTVDPDCPQDVPITDQVQQTTELGTEANRPGDLPLQEPEVQAPMQDASYTPSYTPSDSPAYSPSYTPEDPGVVPLPVESASSGASANALYPTQEFVPSNPELQPPSSQGAITGPTGTAEPLVQGSTGIYQRPPKAMASMTVGLQKSASSGAGIEPTEGAASSNAGAGASQSQNTQKSSLSPYQRVTAQNSLKVLDGKDSAQGSSGGGGANTQGNPPAGTSEQNSNMAIKSVSVKKENSLVVIKPVPSNNQRTLTVVKKTKDTKETSLNVIKPVPSSNQGSLNVAKAAADSKDASLNVIKPVPSSTQGTLGVVQKPKVTAGPKVVYQKSSVQGSADNSPSGSGETGALPMQQAKSGGMTLFKRAPGSINTQTPSASTNQGGQNPSGGMGTYSSSKSTTQGNPQKVYERKDLSQEVADAVSPETSIVATNAVANTQNPEVVAKNEIKRRFGYVPGNFVEGSLVTELVTAEAAAAPVVLRTSDGVVWIGTASVSPDRRVQVSLSRLVAEGVEYPVTGMVFSVAGAPGLDGIFEDRAPTLSSDVMRAGINGVSEFVQNLKDAKSVTTGAAGQMMQSSQVPSLGLTVAGNIAELAKLPDRPVFVNVVRVPKGTPILVAYGIEAITTDRLSK